VTALLRSSWHHPHPCTQHMHASSASTHGGIHIKLLFISSLVSFVSLHTQHCSSLSFSLARAHLGLIVDHLLNVVIVGSPCHLQVHSNNQMMRNLLLQLLFCLQDINKTSSSASSAVYFHDAQKGKKRIQRNTFVRRSGPDRPDFLEKGFYAQKLA